MFLQIAIGSALILLTITIGGLVVMAMEIGFARTHHWLLREPHRPKLLIVIAAVSVGVLMVLSAGIWVWAFAFWGIGAFPTLEESLYFAMVSYTTLGFGDILLPREWRLLAGMAAANGFLGFGLLTALLVEALRHVRLGQLDARRRRD